MEKIATKLEGCFILQPKVFGDSRGWFMESYTKRTFDSLDLVYDFVQDNHAYSEKKGVIRGIHFQNAPYAQSKLVRCSRGKIMDVVVDLRKDSPTFKQWISVELTADNQKQIIIPRGFGHGLITLTEDCEVQYKADNFYDYPSDRSIRFDDPELGIDWGIDSPILSDKDASAPLLSESDFNF